MEPIDSIIPGRMDPVHVPHSAKHHNPCPAISRHGRVFRGSSKPELNETQGTMPLVVGILPHIMNFNSICPREFSQGSLWTDECRLHPGDYRQTKSCLMCDPSVSNLKPSESSQGITPILVTFFLAQLLRTTTRSSFR